MDAQSEEFTIQLTRQDWVGLGVHEPVWGYRVTRISASGSRLVLNFANGYTNRIEAIDAAQAVVDRNLRSDTMGET